MDSTDLADLGKTVGINLSPKEMGSRFNRYSKTGMAERSGYCYRLTELAMRPSRPSSGNGTDHAVTSSLMIEFVHGSMSTPVGILKSRGKKAAAPAA